MKGGSVASDAVSTLVNAETYHKMNTTFDNKAGGGCPCSRGGNPSMKQRGGSTTNAKNATNAASGNSLTNMLGKSTMHALRYGGGVHGSAQLASVPQLMSSDASLAMSVKNRQIGGTKQTKKVDTTKSTNGECKQGKQVAPNTKVSRRKVVQNGGFADDVDIKPIEVSPKLNFSSYSFTPKVSPSASAMDIIANEAISSVPLLQKHTVFGTTASSYTTPFSFAPATGIAPMQPSSDSTVSGMSLTGGSKHAPKKKTPKTVKSETKVKSSKKNPKKPAKQESALDKFFKQLSIK